MKNQQNSLKHRTWLIALAIFLTAQCLPSSALAQAQLTGIWIGKMEINEKVQMTVAFEVSRDENQKLKALMHSIDQDAYDMPVSEVTLEGNQTRMVITPLNAVYTATLQDNGTLEGQLTQGKNSPWKLHMKKVDSLPSPKPRRPQEPTKPYPYVAEDITYRNEAAGVTIAGTLTLPSREGSYPSVLLISGSGPNDRDATIFGHKVFLVLADQLTRAGYAVLRVDDRGTAESTGDFHSASLADLADDVVAGIAYLKTRPEVRKDQIGLIGHSLGADIAPIAAAQSADVAFVVMMSGSAIPLYQGIYEQTEAYYSKKVSPEAVAVNTKVLKAAFETIRSEQNNEKAMAKLAKKFEKINPEVARLTPEEQKFLNLQYPLQPAKFKFFISPAMRADLFHEPAASIRKVKCPVLALNGSLDLQVLPHNLQGIEKALRKGGNSQYTIKLFEGKNHLFQSATDGTPEEYSKIEETIAPDVLEYMVAWMNQLTLLSSNQD